MENVVLDSINTAQDYLPNLRKGLSQISMYLRNGKDSEGTKLFYYALEGLDWFLHVAEAISTFFCSKKTDIKEDLKTYSDIIFNLSEAWGNSDYLLTADIIDYELIPNLKKWNKLVDEILTNNKKSE